MNPHLQGREKQQMEQSYGAREKQEMEKTYVGIDVSKATFDVYCLPEESWQSFPNTPDGISACREKLSGFQETLVVLESTGGYERKLAETLEQAGHAVAVVNPRRTRRFAQACGLLAKTDKIDARVLGHYAATLQPPARGVLDAHRQQLKSLTARRQQLVTMHTAEANRMEHASDPYIASSLKSVLAFLEEEQGKIEREIAQHINNTPEFKQAKENLDSAPGVGGTTASMMVVEIPELGTLNRRQIASLIGTAPFNQDSGKFRGKRMTGGGRGHVRTKLYMPTVVATKHNPVIREFYQRLLAKGKSKMVAIIACMRKLLTILNQMVKDNTRWGENFA